MNVVTPYLIGKIIDEVFIPMAFEKLFRYLLILGSFYAIISLSFWIQGKIMLKLSQEIVFDLRKELFENSKEFQQVSSIRHLMEMSSAEL